MRTPLPHYREDEVEWGGDTKCKGEGEDGFVGFITSSLCCCVRKAEDEGAGEGRPEGGKTGSSSDGWYDGDGLALTSAAKGLVMSGHVSGVMWLWCELIE